MTIKLRSCFLPVALALAALASPTAIAAQAANERPVQGEGPVTRHPEAARAIDQIRSPYCAGLMLEVCPSSGGQALRDSVQALAEEGMSADEIVDWVIANHGEEYRALPKREGASLLMAWVIPPAGILFGLLGVIVVLRRMRAVRPTVAPIRGELSPEEEDTLRQAVRDLDADERATFF
jgi:cytochrome c-type biogenesis protein CcmH/NrfF